MSLDQRFGLAAPESHHFPQANKGIETWPQPLIDTVLLIMRAPAQNERTAIAIFLTMACLLVVAGCGGGSDSDDEASAGKESPPVSNTDASVANTTAPAGNTDFVTEADAICSKGKQRVETEFTSYLEENNLQEIGESGESPAETEANEIQVIETIAIPTLRGQLNELKALEAPNGDEEDFTAYVAAVGKGIEKGEEDPQMLFGSAEKVFAESDTLAGELGFKVCGNR